MKLSRSLALLVVLVLAVLVTLRVRVALDRLGGMGGDEGSVEVPGEVRGEGEALRGEVTNEVGGKVHGELLGEVHEEGEAFLHRELADAGWRWVAVGQEPGWRVLVDGDGVLAFSMIGLDLEGYIVDVGAGDGDVGDVGAEDADSFQWKAMVAEGSKGSKDSMRLEFHREDCMDTMSGYGYAYRVRVEFGDRVFDGCGNALVP